MKLDTKRLDKYEGFKRKEKIVKICLFYGIQKHARTVDRYNHRWGYIRTSKQISTRTTRLLRIFSLQLLHAFRIVYSIFYSTRPSCISCVFLSSCVCHLNSLFVLFATNVWLFFMSLTLVVWREVEICAHARGLSPTRLFGPTTGAKSPYQNRFNFSETAQILPTHPIGPFIISPRATSP